MLQAMGASAVTVGLSGCVGDDPAESGDDRGGGDDGGNGDSRPTDRTEFVGPDGEQVELTFVYPTGSDAVEMTAEFMAQELEDIGFAIEFESLEFSNMIARYVMNEYVGDGEPEFSSPSNGGPREQTESEEPWDLMYGIQFNTYPRTPAATDTFWYREGPANFFGYEPEADVKGLYEKARIEPEPEARQELFDEIFGTISEDVPVNYVSMSDDLTAYQGYVEGPIRDYGGNWDSLQTWSFERQDGGDWVSAEASNAESMYFPGTMDDHSALRVGLTLDGTYAIDENDDIQPLWLDVTDTGDGQVYVCELRDNLRWGDGYGRMTAEDWVYQIEEVHKHEDNWANSAHQNDWKKIENVEQTGELEFQLELENVNPDFPLEPTMWGAYCAPLELYQEYRPDGEALARSDEFQKLQFSGNLGPYTFERWDRSAEFVATRNEDYYGREADDLGDEWTDAPAFDSWSYRVISEESSRIQAFERDEITTVGIPEDRYEEFNENSDIRVVEELQPFLTVMPMNQRRNGWEALRTRAVRQAICYAIDKKTITEQIQRGLAEFTHTFQPRWSKWYDDGEIAEFGVDDSYDKERARDLLDEHTGSDYGYVE